MRRHAGRPFWASVAAEAADRLVRQIAARVELTAHVQPGVLATA
jgi:hypothetical protein